MSADKPENVQLMSSAMNDKACTGKAISFYCSANANPGVTSYQLFENETSILNTSATGMWSKTLESEGVFVHKCVANNSLGSEYSMGVTVTVNGKQNSPSYVCLRTIWKTAHIKTAFACVQSLHYKYVDTGSVIDETQRPYGKCLLNGIPLFMASLCWWWFFSFTKTLRLLSFASCNNM